MLVRRFLGCLFFLIILAVIGAFLFFQFGTKVLIEQAKPEGHFEAPAPADLGLDYSKDSLWLAKPGLSDDPSRFRPLLVSGDALPAPDESLPRAATFFIHPTTYLEKARWNADVEPGGATEMRSRLFVQSQASAFADFGPIWAPRYRQAAYGAFLLKSEDSSLALELAYSDIERAFDNFLAAQDEATPIILAGHSQGSLHLLTLLQKRSEVLKGHLVAAYVAGWPVSRTADLPAMGLNECTSADEAGCVMSWLSFGSPGNTKFITDAWVGTKGENGIERRTEDMICTNPVSGSSAPSLSTDNLGTLVPDGSLTKAELEPGLVAAACEEGFLTIGGDVPNLGPYVLPGNNYHVYDYALFWANIRADAERRLAAFATEESE